MNNLQQRFTEYVSKNNFFDPQHRLLLALSGGRDSVALFHLLADAGFSFSAAHVNFKLRGAESDADESFVTHLCAEKNIKLHVTAVDTLAHAETKGLSVQLAARELRYNWFDQLREQYGYDYIVTAHQHDDSIETFFINALRGTGIKGLSGIPGKSGFVVRPLLFATREELTDYLKKKNVTFRDDSSNAKNDYLRNAIRNELLPVLAKISPAYRDQFFTTFSNLSEQKFLLQEVVSEFKTKHTHEESGLVYIEIKPMLKYGAALLAELILPYGFNSSQVHLIYEQLEGASGKKFFSATHQLLKDREKLEITLMQAPQVEKVYTISDQLTHSDLPLELEFELCETKIAPSASQQTAVLDYSLLTFPLLLRRYKTGDRFKPFGMKGKSKKVSDFLTDLKLSANEKEKTWVLLSGEEICWVVGFRIAEDFAMQANTKKVVRISLLK